MNPKKLLKRLAKGELQNVHFQDFVTLVKAFGFELKRIKGSHQIFAHPEIAELVNLQNVDGKMKPYQVRQFLRLVERYNILMEEE